MTVEGAPVWNLATLMPDGAVGASAAGGRAVLLARTFVAEHRGQVGRYDAAELARLCQELECVQEALTVSYAYYAGLELIDRNLDEARDVAPAIRA